MMVTDYNYTKQRKAAKYDPCQVSGKLTANGQSMVAHGPNMDGGKKIGNTMVGTRAGKETYQTGMVGTVGVITHRMIGPPTAVRQSQRELSVTRHTVTNANAANKCKKDSIQQTRTKLIWKASHRTKMLKNFATNPFLKLSSKQG